MPHETVWNAWCEVGLDAIWQVRMQQGVWQLKQTPARGRCELKGESGGDLDPSHWGEGFRFDFSVIKKNVSKLFSSHS